jgi:hypothetical protein
MMPKSDDEVAAMRDSDGVGHGVESSELLQQRITVLEGRGA